MKKLLCFLLSIMLTFSYAFSVACSNNGVMLPQFPDTDLAVLTAVTARHREIDAWNTALTMEQSSLERLEAVMTEAGELEKEQWVDFAALVDNHWAEAVK